MPPRRPRADPRARPRHFWPYGWAKKHQDIVLKYVRFENGWNREENTITEAKSHRNQRVN